jgi:hypothetical protein
MFQEIQENQIKIHSLRIGFVLIIKILDKILFDYNPNFLIFLLSVK